VSGKLEWYIHVSFDSALGPKSFDLLTCCVSSYSYRSRAYSCFGRQFGHEEILSSSVKKCPSSP
jgi:hypothetical protein